MDLRALARTQDGSYFQLPELGAIDQQRFDETIICLEYWCYDQDSIWSRDNNELVALATSETYATSLVPGGAIKEGRVVSLPRCYPVYSTGYKAHVDWDQKFLSSQPGIQQSDDMEPSNITIRIIAS